LLPAPLIAIENSSQANDVDDAQHACNNAVSFVSDEPSKYQHAKYCEKPKPLPKRSQ